MTPDVELRPIGEEDVDFWAELLAEPEARAYQPLKVRSRSRPMSEIGEYGEENIDHPAHRKFKWVVLDRHNGGRVGVISLEKLDLEHGIARIGYTISKRFWNRGCGTAAVRALTGLGFSEGRLERIEAECAVQNTASRKVLEKCGYRLEGLKRGYLEIGGRRVDHYSFGILRDDWKASIDD